MKKINEICKFALRVERRRGDAILCLKDKPEKDVLFFINFPDKISDVPNCVATTMFSTGHATPDTYTNINKMDTCEDRISGKAE